MRCMCGYRRPELLQCTAGLRTVFSSYRQNAPRERKSKDQLLDSNPRSMHGILLS